jgi:phage gpG-like protein
MDALIKRLDAIGEPKPLLRALQLSTIHEAQALVPRKTGLLQRRILPGAITDDHAIVKADTPYAAPVEFGSKAHTITAKPGHALAFASQRITTERFGAGAKLKFRKSGRLTAGSMRKYGNAAFVVVKSVHIPAIKAHPYLIPGARKAAGGLKDLIITRWNTAA